MNKFMVPMTFEAITSFSMADSMNICPAAYFSPFLPDFIDWEMLCQGVPPSPRLYAVWSQKELSILVGGPNILPILIANVVIIVTASLLCSAHCSTATCADISSWWDQTKWKLPGPPPTTAAHFLEQALTRASLGTRRFLQLYKLKMMFRVLVCSLRNEQI